MRVKAIMLPYEQLSCIKVTDTVETAIRIIDQHELLSLPVVDGKRFVGVLSKQFVFEEFFRCGDVSKAEFLQKKVQEFMRTTIEPIPEEMRIEEAAVRFITSKVRFIPITDKNGELLGIVTQQAVFKQYQKMFGHEHNSLVIYTYDSRGTMAKLCETIAKAGGDIRNMLVMHTDVMNLVEIFLRIEAEDFERVVKALDKQKFDVRDISFAKKQEGTVVRRPAGYEYMKKILLLATGGTIASKHSANGLCPQIDAGEILSYVPQIREFCEAFALQVCNIDSTNIEPSHWRLMLRTIRENYEKYDGFVIAHGTDTMAYTAAALSYMIQNSEKPIVITGAQKSIDLEITDAKTNLTDSFRYAADEESQGVQIVFGGKVIAGTRAKKIRSKSYNAFESIDYPYLAMIQDTRIMRYIPMLPYREQVHFYERLDENIFLLKLIPGISPAVLRFLFEEHDCIIVESFGVGGIPTSIAEEFYRLCREFPDTVVIMATQVAHEGSDMTVYEVGNKIKQECKILESYDMTLEAVIAKAMWMLGTGNIGTRTVEEAFYRRVNYDIIFTNSSAGTKEGAGI